MYTTINAGGNMNIPVEYQTKSVEGDLGIIVGSEDDPNNNYVAKSISCVQLESSKRPIWGMVMWNNPYLQYDQVGFQQILFIGVILI